MIGVRFGRVPALSALAEPPHMKAADVLLPLPPGEGRGVGVLAAERGTGVPLEHAPASAWTVPQDPLTPTLSRREREPGRSLRPMRQPCGEVETRSATGLPHRATPSMADGRHTLIASSHNPR